MKRRLSEFPLFFLSYDEPFKEERWKKIKELFPKAQWIDGIKGFDRAHKVCAENSQTQRFVVIDGDNVLLNDFGKERIPAALENSTCVLSWSSLNSINGLQYGNGGVKCWDKDVVLKMRTHELSQKEEALTDFCFETPYYQFSHALSRSVVHLSPFQAFRAGFREGVKMSLIQGRSPGDVELKKGIKEFLPEANYFRLMAWMSLGSDVENGVWAILGARQGLYMHLCESFPLQRMKGHDWLSLFWHEEIAPHYFREKEGNLMKVIKAIETLGLQLFEATGMRIPFYNPSSSRRRKAALPNPVREGLMTHD